MLLLVLLVDKICLLGDKTMLYSFFWIKNLLNKLTLNVKLKSKFIKTETILAC